MGNKKNSEITKHASAAEYLTYVAAAGSDERSFEMRYEDENIWLTQKMMAALYNVSVQNVGQHIKKVFEDGELSHDSVIKKYFITAADAKDYETMHYNLQMAKLHAETEYEKYRIIQDRLFESDFDRFAALEQSLENLEGDD